MTSYKGQPTVGIIGSSAYGGRRSDPVVIHCLVGIHDHTITLSRVYVNVIASNRLVVHSIYFDNL